MIAGLIGRMYLNWWQLWLEEVFANTGVFVFSFIADSSTSFDECMADLY